MAFAGSVLARAQLSNGALLSDPIQITLGLHWEYFPFPQPESNTMEPAGRDSKKFLTLGHGRYL